MVDTEASADLETKIEAGLHELRFYLGRSIRYHLYLERHYDRFSAVASVVSVVFGSAAAASALGGLPKWVSISAALTVTVFSAIDMIRGSSKKARLHAELARSFRELAVEVQESELLTLEQLRAFRVRIGRIELDEPPHLRVLNAICHNEQCRADGSDPEYEYQVGSWQRLLAPFMDWRPGTLRRAIDCAPPADP